MPTVSMVLSRKGSGVVCATRTMNVLEAAQLMNVRRIGSLVVGRPGGHVEGIISERDILTRIVAAAKDPEATRVEQVMTTPVITCAPSTDLDELRATMRDRRIRHVPVCDERGGLCGLVSIGDLNATEVEQLNGTVHALEEYIQRG